MRSNLAPPPKYKTWGYFGIGVLVNLQTKEIHWWPYWIYLVYIIIYTL